MTFTTHGHHIVGTILDVKLTPIERCGGPGVCNQCSREAIMNFNIVPLPEPNTEYFDEDTLLKVYKVLMDYGLTQTEAQDLIDDFQNEGILFRERVKNPEVPISVEGKDADREVRP
jgi:hypothetical protein